MPHDIAYSLTQVSPDRDFLTLRDLLSGYYAVVQGIDDNVGRLIQKLKEWGNREKAASLKSCLDAWFLEYVDPAIDAAREPVQGRGQLCKVGPASAGQLTFHPATDVEYRR